MYSQDNVRVMHPTERLSAQFSCGIGVKQGCPLSPLLFGLYLDGFEKHLYALDGDSPPQLVNIIVKLLLYAYDLALMLETPQGLHKQIDVLSEFCVERQLVINVSKTKVVVFEKCCSAAPEFTYRGTTIKRVQSFKYLGLELHSTRGMAVAIYKLTIVGKKALFALRRRCNDLSITDPEVMCQLFDSLVRPVLSYACKVWTSCIGAKRLQQAEQVHRIFLRGILRVNKPTSIFAVLREFGRYPLEYFWWQQTLKYYDRLWESTPDRMLYCAYQTQLQLLSVLNDNQQCWLRNVQLWLDDQGVGVLYTNVKCDVASAQASYLESTYGEQARARSSRLRTYQLMNASCTTEFGYSYAHQSYLQAITNVQLRQSLSRFRCSNHRLEVECGRHAKPESVLRRDRVCHLCPFGAVEDEDHLLLVCPAHHDIWCKFGQQLGKQLTPCSLLPELMHSTNQKAVALYLVSCLDNMSVLLKPTR
jgi:hypothetical protein